MDKLLQFKVKTNVAVYLIKATGKTIQVCLVEMIRSIHEPDEEGVTGEYYRKVGDRWRGKKLSMTIDRELVLYKIEDPKIIGDIAVVVGTVEEITAVEKKEKAQKT